MEHVILNWALHVQGCKIAFQFSGPRPCEGCRISIGCNREIKVKCPPMISIPITDSKPLLHSQNVFHQNCIASAAPTPLFLFPVCLACPPALLLPPLAVLFLLRFVAGIGGRVAAKWLAMAVKGSAWNCGFASTCCKRAVSWDLHTPQIHSNDTSDIDCGIRFQRLRTTYPLLQFSCRIWDRRARSEMRYQILMRLIIISGVCRLKVHRDRAIWCVRRFQHHSISYAALHKLSIN